MRQRLRHALHATLCIAAFFPWLVGVVGFGAALWLTILADRLWPDADWGNCWTFVGPKWFRHGGYVQMRMAHSPRIAGVRFIPHAIWVRQAHPETRAEQTVPVARITSWRQALQTLYFKLRVVQGEPPACDRRNTQTPP
jgi:hypothetical protein